MELKKSSNLTINKILPVAFEYDRDTIMDTSVKQLIKDYLLIDSQVLGNIPNLNSLRAVCKLVSEEAINAVKLRRQAINTHLDETLWGSNDSLKPSDTSIMIRNVITKSLKEDFKGSQNL